MQLYSENEKAFLLIHFNLNYGTDSLPYTPIVVACHSSASVPPPTSLNNQTCCLDTLVTKAHSYRFFLHCSSLALFAKKRTLFTPLFKSDFGPAGVSVD